MKRRALACAILIFFMALLFYPREERMGQTISLRAADLSLSLAHPFGTDGLGRDQLARVQSVLLETTLPLWGLAIAALVAGLSCTGLFANSPRISRWTGRALLPLTTTPLFITVFFLAALFEKTGFWSVTLCLIALCFARAFQAFGALLRESEHLGYWQAHALLGGSTRERFLSYGVLRDWRAEGVRLIFFHLQVVLTAETALSYLGFGIAEPQASFGNMLAASYGSVLKGQTTFAFILVAVISLTLLVPPSIATLFSRESFPARKTPSRSRPFPDKASRPSAANLPGHEEDPAWENA